MKDIWTKEELEVYISYCKLNNIKYDCIWMELDEEDVERALEQLNRKMLAFDKLVKIYLDTKYVKTIRYSLIDFVQDEFPNKILTWISANFKLKESMAEFIDHQIQLALQNINHK